MIASDRTDSFVFSAEWRFWRVGGHGERRPVPWRWSAAGRPDGRAAVAASQQGSQPAGQPVSRAGTAGSRPAGAERQAGLRFAHALSASNRSDHCISLMQRIDRRMSRPCRSRKTSVLHLLPRACTDPATEHDACGVGFVVHIKGQRSHDIVRKALQVLINLEHRGACGCEANTGDGAGILIQMPDALLAPGGAVSPCRRPGLTLPVSCSCRTTTATASRSRDHRPHHRRRGADAARLA